jgi:hypothetical protein
MIGLINSLIYVYFVEAREELAGAKMQKAIAKERIKDTISSLDYSRQHGAHPLRWQALRETVTMNKRTLIQCNIEIKFNKSLLRKFYLTIVLITSTLIFVLDMILKGKM